MTRGQFSKQLLEALHAPYSLHNRRALASWYQSEGGSARYNPLNTTQREPGSTNFNAVPVQNYVSANSGLTATIATLRNGQYKSILSCLRENAPATETLEAIGRSPWGTDESLMLAVLQDAKRDLRPLESKTISH